MIIKAIYAVGVLSLICAGGVFMQVGRQYLLTPDRPGDEAETSITERFQARGGTKGKDGKAVVSPLIEQATAFARYLAPPAPKTHRVAARSTASVRSVHRAAGMTPKFRLLATTYYRSSPDRSLALVSEPGKGDHWVKKDERLGHFVVESVGKDSIVCRDGTRLHEVKVPTKKAIQLAKAAPRKSIPTQAVKPNLRLLNASGSKRTE